jgi:hypothetical protein
MARSRMVRMRLTCQAFYVDVRLRELNGRFIASADTPNGPSLGVGGGVTEAIRAALEPFGDAVQDLMASLPRAVPG